MSRRDVKTLQRLPASEGTIVPDVLGSTLTQKEACAERRMQDMQETMRELIVTDISSSPNKRVQFIGPMDTGRDITEDNALDSPDKYISFSGTRETGRATNRRAPSNDNGIS